MEDIQVMQYALTSQSAAPSVHSNQAEGTLLRRSAIGAGVGYSLLMVAMIVATPELVASSPFRFFWTLVVLAAIASYGAGLALGRSADPAR
jgi:hypothetical protein